MSEETPTLEETVQRQDEQIQNLAAEMKVLAEQVKQQGWAIERIDKQMLEMWQDGS